MYEGIRAMWMRGGTSKGGYFLETDLPECPETRNRLLLDLMGSPDSRQIDGMGGGDPLTSKVAIVRKSERQGIDVDYLFLQVFVDQALVTDKQNCGNILAGVGPFAIERGLVSVDGEETAVTVFMENTGQVALLRIATPNGKVSYDGDARIDGVPGSASAIPIEFKDTAGSTCGSLFPSGNVSDVIDGITVTMIDNGMPSVVIDAAELGLSGDETPAMLEANDALREKLERVRLKCGSMMGLGDVEALSVPKMSIVSKPRSSGAITTRTFIPHRCHKAIGVLGAVSVATACLTPGAVGSALAQSGDGQVRHFSVEHPTGEMKVIMRLANHEVVRAEVLRTARKLMDGEVFGRFVGS